MMYVAQRHLPVKMPDGSTAEFAPGEEVVGFETWPSWQRRIHLDHEFVVNTQGPLLADRLVAPTAPATRPSLTHTQQKSQADEVKEAIASKPVVQPADVETLQATDTVTLVCAHCDKGPFKSEHGLRLHMGKAHA